MATSDAGQVRRRLALLALLSVTAAAGCTRIDDALASVPVFAFMRNSPAFDPYQHPLPPPPGAVPFQSPGGPALPPLEATETALNAWAAGPWGQNPFDAGDAAALALGRVMYERHCAVCHGAQGAGDGPLTGPGKFQLMPPLVSGNAITLSDGYVYGVIRAGRGLMPAYGARMTHEERWAVVTYVNSLQTAAGVQQPQQPGEGAAPEPESEAPPEPAPTPAPAADTTPGAQ